MTNKSGVAEQVISLPKSGGAGRGLGEKFRPDLFTGAGNFAIPIGVPPGRNGMQPELNLAYSTGYGNGPFGLGWNLNVPGVTIKTSKGIPRYQGQDIYLLSGMEDLLPVGEEVTGQGERHAFYRPRTESLFARILHITGNGVDRWEVTAKNGSFSVYGADSSSRIWDEDWLVGGANRIFQWLLAETRDPFGNRIVYSYKREDRAGLDNALYEKNHSYNQVYLSKIEYAGYLPTGSVQEKFLYSVEFDYGEYDSAGNATGTWSYRPDPFSSYKAGFEIRTARRCKRILLKLHEEQGPAGGQLIKSYNLSYLDELTQVRHGTTRLPLNNLSQLVEVRLTGYRLEGDGKTVSSEDMPPLTLGYTSFEPEKRRYRNLTAQGGALPERGLHHPQYELVDLHGYGLPDILQTTSQGYRYWRNLGNGRFGLPQTMREAPAGLSLEDSGVQLADMEGTGSADLLVTTGPLSGYFPTNFNARWSARSFRKYAQAPSFDLEDPDIKLTDMNGDGIVDALQTGPSYFAIYYNQGAAGWSSQAQFLPRGQLEDFPDVTFSAPSQQVRLAGLSGSGLQDMVLIQGRQIQYWPNLGYGRWGKRLQMRHSPLLPSSYDPKRLILADIDGDGYADLLYIEDGHMTFWINQAGNSWSDPQVIRGTPSFSDGDSVRVVDILGIGTAGILWSYDRSQVGVGGNQSNYKFLDLTGEIKPYLLHEMDSHTGSLTRVEYAPSTRFYLQDLSERRPWLTHLPFPVQVVARSEMIDFLSGSKLTTQYRYHHGYYDGIEREFRGFGRVDQQDTELFDNYNAPGLHGNQPFEQVPTKAYSSPLLSLSWFHLGPVKTEDDDWEEVNFTSEFWGEDQPVLDRPPTMKDMLAGLPRQARRDALRALRGNVVRNELYALDSSPHQARPYTVTETLTGVREEAAESSPSLPPGEERRKIFFSHLLAERVTQWERGTEPLTTFKFLGNYDRFGQACFSLNIAIPRGRDYQVALPGNTPASPYLVTFSLTTYVEPQLDSPAGQLQPCLADRVACVETYQVPNDGRADLASLRAKIERGEFTTPDNLLKQSLNYYDGPAYQGLPYRQVGAYGSLVRSESLSFRAIELQQAFPGGLPPYLDPAASITSWTAEYPVDFRNQLPSLAGYRFYEADGLHTPGYYTCTQQWQFDFQAELPGRGLVVATQDSLGHEVQITYDDYGLVPVQIRDAAGLDTKATYDYRVLQPSEVRDANGNTSVYTFTPIGMLETASLLGKQNEGDTLEQPGSRFSYDFKAFMERGEPLALHTVRRVYHAGDPRTPVTTRDQTLESVEYYDGFGRLLQTCQQTSEQVFGNQVFGDAGLTLPDPASAMLPTPGNATGLSQPGRVLVKGWRVYNNKGQVVQKYEDFFATGWGFRPRKLAGPELFGACTEFYYDPRNKVIRTVYPDGSEQRVIQGIPRNLADPDDYTPTPWEAYTYDGNDNAGRTHPSLSRPYNQHWNTPSSVAIDALGRTITTVERNGPHPATDWYSTGAAYDLRGNQLSLTDSLNRVVARYVYDLDNRLLRSEQLDAGVTTTMIDAKGNLIEQRDSKGALILNSYDNLNRPLQLWARDRVEEPLSLRLLNVYGESLDLDFATSNNLRGHLFYQYDEAGRLTCSHYDFKGNLLEKSRQTFRDNLTLAAVNAAAANNWQINTYKVNWQPPPGTSLEDFATSLLDATVYEFSYRYDGLNRLVGVRYPQDVSGERKELVLVYNSGGDLEGVNLAGQTYVEKVAYNSRGQRLLIAYGNGIMTRYAYDPQTFRLTWLRTEQFFKLSDTVYQGKGALLQDLYYRYDQVGNVIAIQERTPGCGIPATLAGPDQLNRAFNYDPLYRLISAAGRESDLPFYNPAWDEVNTLRNTDPTRTRFYSEQYSYDPVGNLLQINHQAGISTNYNYIYTFNPGSNRLSGLTQGSNQFAYRYDNRGNLVQENVARWYEWNYRDRLQSFKTQAGTAEPSLYAQYFYDANGQRVKKVVRKQGGEYEVTIYFDNLFEHRRNVRGATTSENNGLHLLDNEKRITLIRVGEPLNGDTGPAIQYFLGDHLDSSNLIVDQSGSFINREEFLPYGETSFGSFARKRYRFTGKERDEESGLYYHGARYYAPWLARWTNCDPGGMVDGANVYRYGRNNPLRYADPKGQQVLEASSSAMSAASSETAVLLSGAGSYGGTGAASATATLASGEGALATGLQGSALATGEGALATGFQTSAVVGAGETTTSALMETAGTGVLNRIGIGTLAGSTQLGLAIVGILIPGNLFQSYCEGPNVNLDCSPRMDLPGGSPGGQVSLPGNSGPSRVAPGASGGARQQEPGGTNRSPVSLPGRQTGPTLQAGKPNTERQSEHCYWGWYVDPFTNQVVTGQNSVMGADHIYPAAKISQMPGFNTLSPRQQYDVLNYSNNFQPLPTWLNSSKGAKDYFEWQQAPTRAGDPSTINSLSPEYLKDMQELTLHIKQELQQMIDYHNKINYASQK